MTPLRLALSVLAGVIVVIVVVVFAYNFDPFGRLKNAKTTAANATAQVGADTATIKGVDHYTEHVTIVREKADRAVEAVQAAPGADDPVPGEVLAAWRKGLSE